MTRMRLIKLALKELRALDPNTCVSEHFLRVLINTGKIPYIKCGNRFLINFDKLLEYLATTTDAPQEDDQQNQIRRIVG